jgi:AcrR family transcriptional regulator
VDSVSTRQISREAGQKNHSALQYHFGNRDGMIDAILRYRMSAVNQRRQRMLTQAKESGNLDDIRTLIEIMVRPFAEELRHPPSESYYISLISQLFSQQDGERLYFSDADHFNAMREVTTRLRDKLINQGTHVMSQRLAFLATQMVHSVASWDYQRREGFIVMTPAALERHIVTLIDFLHGGITAPVSEESRV